MKAEVSVRTRTRVVSSDTKTCSYDYNGWYGDCTDPKRPYPPNIPNPRVYSNNYVERLETTTTEDVEIDNFYKRRAKGEVFCNPYKRTRVEVLDQPGAISTFQLAKRVLSGCPSTDIWHGCSRSGSVPASKMCAGRYSAVPYINIPPMIDLAVAKAFSNVGLSDANLIVTSGEMKETLGFLTQSFRKSAKIFRAVRRLDLRALKGEIKPSELKKRYLEYRYAIRPMVAEVDSIISGLTADRWTERRTFRGKETASATTSFTGASGWLWDTYDQISIGGQAVRVVTVRAGVLTEIKQVLDHQVWGLDRPIEAMWELVPFSFIVDWFVNVGRTIGSWTPKFGFTTLASWVVIEDITTYTSFVEGWTSGAIYNKTANATGSGTLRKIVDVKERIPHPARAVLPTWNVKLDALKLLDLTVITEQLARRFRS